MAKAKTKEKATPIKQGERIEVTMKKDVTGLIKGKKYMIHPITAESFKKRGYIE